MGDYTMQEKILGTALPSVAALAYLGDARHSLYVRRMLVARGISKSGELNRIALSYVTAEAQAESYRKIKEMLTEEEGDVFRRAANSTHLNKPKHASIADYRHATGFEAVLGMLTWLSREERITELLDAAYKDPTPENG